MRSVSACTSLIQSVACSRPAMCQRGQTHRFRRCSSAATGALEHSMKNSRNGNKEELYFTFAYTRLHYVVLDIDSCQILWALTHPEKLCESKYSIPLSLCYKYIDVLKYVALGFKQVYVVQSDIL